MWIQNVQILTAESMETTPVIDVFNLQLSKLLCINLKECIKVFGNDKIVKTGSERVELLPSKT